MKELRRLLDAAAHHGRTRHPFAVASVVKIAGSTYRRPGARMLVAPDGTTIGTLSGGCLEREVARQALTLLNGGAPRVLPFDLGDDDLILGFGTGCDGVVHVLIEPVPAPGRTAPTALLARCFDRRRSGLLVQITDAPAESDLLARRVLLLDDGSVQGDLSPSDLRETLLVDAARVLADDRSRIGRYDTDAGPVEVLFEVVHPPVRLFIFGGGHDVAPLVRFAHAMGWLVTVVGARPADELAARFPDADDHVFLMHPDEALAYATLDAHSAAVVMNHRYERDRALVSALLRSEVPYVGVLGPRERTARLVAELRGTHDDLTDAHLARLHGPVGLDIGTETPEEIALAVVAEIQAVRHGRTGGLLRDGTGAIHETVTTI